MLNNNKLSYFVRRSVGNTEINEQSSRGHGVFMILISGVNEVLYCNGTNV